MDAERGKDGLVESVVAGVCVDKVCGCCADLGDVKEVDSVGWRVYGVCDEDVFKVGKGLFEGDRVSDGVGVCCLEERKDDRDVAEGEGRGPLSSSIFLVHGIEGPREGVVVQVEQHRVGRDLVGRYGRQRHPHCPGQLCTAGRGRGRVDVLFQP